MMTSRSSSSSLSSNSSSEEYANQSQEIFLQAILSEFSDREMSPFMVDRLVKLCRAEYRANVAWKHGLDMVQADCQEDSDWWKQTVQVEEDNKVNAVQELQAQIRETQREMERIQLRRRIGDLRSRMQKLKGGGGIMDADNVDESTMQKNASLAKDDNDCSYFVPMAMGESSKKTPILDNDEKNVPGEWIDIDDDYFQAKSDGAGSSEWVLCS